MRGRCQDSDVGDHQPKCTTAYDGHYGDVPNLLLQYWLFTTPCGTVMVTSSAVRGTSANAAVTASVTALAVPTNRAAVAAAEGDPDDVDDPTAAVVVVVDDDGDEDGAEAGVAEGAILGNELCFRLARTACDPDTTIGRTSTQHECTAHARYVIGRPRSWLDGRREEERGGVRALRARHRSYRQGLQLQFAHFLLKTHDTGSRSSRSSGSNG